MVLKHKRQQSDNCCSKKGCICSKPSRIQAVKTLAIGLVGGPEGGGGGFPPLFEISCMKPWRPVPVTWIANVTLHLYRLLLTTLPDVMRFHMGIYEFEARARA